MMIRTLCAAVTIGFLAPSAQGGDYHLTLLDTGMREYYCQITVELENRSSKPLTEISGYFYNYIGTERVGRSKGTWFMNVSPGETAVATFETPNGPCTDDVRYEFIVGACRFGQAFEDTSACASLLSFTDPLSHPDS